MVSLTNQARLLAAQEFNRRVIAAKLAAGERVSRARFGVLTGRVATIDPRTKRVTAISNIKSRTALETDARLRKEIQRQRTLATRQTDLERFLTNERALSTGRFTGKQIRAQIRSRKRRGLSKTPAQRAALARLVRQESTTALSARARRKRARGARPVTPTVTFGRRRSEEARAFGLGSSPFSDPVFQFGGRTRAEVVRRGGIAGRRASGESFSDTLSFVRSSRLGASRERIGFAQGLLGGFGGRSTSDLLSIVGSQRRSRDPVKAARGALTQIPLAPATFEQRIRAGEGRFTTEAIPFTFRDAPDPSRRRLKVAARKREDVGKAERARREISRQRGLSDIERISVLGSQVIEGRRIPRVGVDPTARLEAARATQRETELLRSLSFGEPIPVRATGVATRTPQTFAPSGRQFQLGLSDTIRVSDRLATARKRLSNAKARGKSATTKAGKAKAQQAVKKQQRNIADITRDIRQEIRTRTVGAAVGAVRAGADVFGDLFNFEGGDTLGNLFSGTIVPATGQTEAINIFDVSRDIGQTFQLGR